MTRAKRRARRRIRRRIFIASAAVIILAGAGFAVARVLEDSPPQDAAAVAPTTTSTTAVSATSSTTASTTTTTTTIPSSTVRLHLVRTVTGEISPKSVAASGTGLVFAQNMMYRHTVTVYDRDGNLVQTIPDSVDLAGFGVPDHPGVVRGAPVEAAFMPDGRYAYVSNYSMYGAGFGPEGTDE